MEKRERIETIEKKTEYWVAYDGAVFYSEDACKKYEERWSDEKDLFEKTSCFKRAYIGDVDPFCQFGPEDNLFGIFISSNGIVENVNKWVDTWGYDPGNSKLSEKDIGTIQFYVNYCDDYWRIGTPEEFKDSYVRKIDELTENVREAYRKSQQKNT